MSGTSAWLAGRVASLLPNTTAGACVPASPWPCGSVWSSPDPCTACVTFYTCHHSCHGGTIRTANTQCSSAC